jgi:hypothetical protein
MRSLLLAALAFAAPAAFAEETGNGFYLGLGVGQSRYGDSLADQLERAYDGRYDYRVDYARLKDRSDTAGKFTVGYQFLPWLGAELAYTDAGEVKSEYRLIPKPLLNTGAVTAAGRYQVTGTSAALVATWPIGDVFALAGRVGAVDARVKYDESGHDAGPQSYTFHRTVSNTDTFGGVSLVWRFSTQWSARLDYDRWFDVGDRYALDPDGNGRFKHLDVVTANLMYHFAQ